MLEFWESFRDFVSYQPWPWWVGGMMIALVMFALMFFGKEFGISANLRAMCAAEGAGRFSEFFNYDWGRDGWNLMVALGAMFGGYMTAHYFAGSDGHIAHVSAATVESLKNVGMHYTVGEVPLVPEFYSWESLLTLRGFIIIVVGGFLVGFGARYAGGCTSGHAISGLSSLQLPSLVAVIGFFIGGLIMSYLILPWLLQL